MRQKLPDDLLETQLLDEPIGLAPHIGCFREKITRGRLGKVVSALEFIQAIQSEIT
jgi:hypothetical protein